MVYGIWVFALNNWIWVIGFPIGPLIDLFGLILGSFMSSIFWCWTLACWVAIWFDLGLIAFAFACWHCIENGRNMDAVGASEDRAWVELTKDQNFGIKKGKKMGSEDQKEEDGSGGFFKILSVGYFVRALSVLILIFFSFILEAFEGHYRTSKVIY